jgi:hypothetical protein
LPVDIFPGIPERLGSKLNHTILVEHPEAFDAATMTRVMARSRDGDRLLHDSKGVTSQSLHAESVPNDRANTSGPREINDRNANCWQIGAGLARGI